MADLDDAARQLERLRAIGREVREGGMEALGDEIIDISDAVLDVIADAVTGKSERKPAPGAHAVYMARR
jgi:hypothetical protein